MFVRSFTVHQTTYRIGNLVYFWIRLDYDDLMSRIHAQTPYETTLNDVLTGS